MTHTIIHASMYNYSNHCKRLSLKCRLDSWTGLGIFENPSLNLGASGNIRCNVVIYKVVPCCFVAQRIT